MQIEYHCSTLIIKSKVDNIFEEDNLNNIIPILF